MAALPGQEAAQPHLAAGADHQIEIRQMAGVHVPTDRLFVDLQVLQPAVVSRGMDHGLEGIHNL